MLFEEYSQDLSKQYDYFNKLFFNNELSKIDVSFEKYSRGSSGAAGMYHMSTPRRISLNAESFTSRSDKYIDSVLIHEMIHHWMDENNLDTHQHHSKRFKDKVDEINSISGNKYRVGYTEVSASIDDDELETKKTYWVLPLIQSGLALKNVQATFHVMSEENYSLEEVMRFLEWLNYKTNTNTKSIYILEVNINNNFITEDYLKGKIDVIPKGYYTWATEYDKHLFKLLKQSKDYSIIGRYDWKAETFVKTNKEQEGNTMKTILKEVKRMAVNINLPQKLIVGQIIEDIVWEHPKVFVSLANGYTIYVKPKEIALAKNGKWVKVDKFYEQLIGLRIENVFNDTAGITLIVEEHWQFNLDFPTEGGLLENNNNLNKVYLKEGIKVIAENGDIYEVEDGDYTIIDNQIRNGPILNIDIVKSIYDDEKRAKILDLIDEYGENYIINQLITGMNIELEHTDDNYESLQLSVDHVVEIHDYYTRLIAMEKEARNE